jgi:hypothetical protein
MPVTRYRSVEEIPPPPLRERGSEALLQAIAATWSRAAWLAPLRFPPGVHRHRSIQEMNETTDAWGLANAVRLRQERLKRG